MQGKMDKGIVREGLTLSCEVMRGSSGCKATRGCRRKPLASHFRPLNSLGRSWCIRSPNHENGGIWSSAGTERTAACTPAGGESTALPRSALLDAERRVGKRGAGCQNGSGASVRGYGG